MGGREKMIQNRPMQFNWRDRVVKYRSIHKLPASLTDDTARMNDRNKHKATGQMKHQTADPKANASVFLFFPTAQTAHLLLPQPHNPTLKAKSKEPFFANAII